MQSTQTLARISFTLMLLVGVAGCPPLKPPPPPPRQVDAVIDQVNEYRAAPLTPLYAPSVAVSGSLLDPEGRRFSFDLRGKMAMQWPRSIFLKFGNPVEPDLVYLGSNDDEYWVSIGEGMNTMWWGRHENTHQVDKSDMPVDPLWIADALGMRALPGRDLSGPLRMVTETQDLLLYGEPGADRKLLLDRVYHVDRYPPYQIVSIDYYDSVGQLLMTVTVDRYQAISGAADDERKFPRRFKINWPSNDSWMTLEIEQIESREQLNPKTFDRPLDPPGNIRYIERLDRPKLNSRLNVDSAD